jgi:DNA-binding NarL/FixJ family response regulator
MNAGVSGFVLKRTAVTDLFTAVDEVLGGKTFVSPLLEYEC